MLFGRNHKKTKVNTNASYTAKVNLPNSQPQKKSRNWNAIAIKEVEANEISNFIPLGRKYFNLKLVVADVHEQITYAD